MPRELATLAAMRGPPADRTVVAISRRLRALRIGLGLTQAELCRRTHIGKTTWNNYEKAKGRPDLDEAIKLCDNLDVTLDWIYFGDTGRVPHDVALAIEQAQARM